MSKDTSEESANDCDHSVNQSVVSFGDIVFLPSYDGSIRSRFDDMHVQSCGILSPSTSIVHLLGSMRDDDEEDSVTSYESIA